MESKMTKQPMCIVHINPDGSTYYAKTEGVRLFVVDERTPADRVYEISTTATTQEVEEVLGDDPVGCRGDGSPAEVRAHKAASMIEGRSHLTVISDKTLTEGEG